MTGIDRHTLFDEQANVISSDILSDCAVRGRGGLSFLAGVNLSVI